MASFDSINYSLRPSKTVQRGLVFDGLKEIWNAIDMSDAVYIGLGSIWFTDFVQAHKVLGIETMFSVEVNDIGFKRAKFNRTFRTITIKHGLSSDEVPKILKKTEFSRRPWVIWLDYDSALDEDMVEEMQWVLENAPPNSVALFTFSASQNAYGRPRNRPDRVRTLLGDVVPDDLSQDDCDKESLPLTLASLTSNFLRSEVADSARPGGFFDAFRISYFDTVGMVTVGGILPAKGSASTIKAIIEAPKWHCKIEEMIRAPHLTLKEAAVLLSEMPSDSRVTRKRIRELGFDLEVSQIRSFQKYYKYLPSYAEIVV